jgi:glyoxylase-like metal-dependent hydrolase (beta-lactamase superfamily II)
MAAYEVIAVRYATRAMRKSEAFYHYQAYGEPDAELDMDYFFWVLRRGEEAILVDTGFAPAVGARRGRTCLCEPLEALARIGVEPGSIGRIVLTHLHWDHTGNLAAFPGAELVVQRRELDFWTGPYARRLHFASLVEPDEIQLVERARREGRLRILDGDAQIADGIRAICVGGHSPGQQVTVVEAAAGPVVLASDAIHFYEELERDRPFAVLWNLEQMYSALDVLRELARTPGSALVAGHDPAVLDRFPPLGSGLEGLAVRAG